MVSIIHFEEFVPKSVGQSIERSTIEPCSQICGMVDLFLAIEGDAGAQQDDPQ